MSQHPSRTYDARQAIVFCRMRDPYGELANTHSRLPVRVGSIVEAPNAEALYQALRFEDPGLQRPVLAQKNPMKAKYTAHDSIHETRSDWQRARIEAMRLTIRLKSAHHPFLQQMLLDTGDLPIVERSSKDDFWGAKPQGQQLVGVNALGRLWMELRAELRQSPECLDTIHPPAAERPLMLLGQPLQEPIPGAEQDADTEDEADEEAGPR